MFNSATVKLTVWYVTMFFGLSVVFSGVLYVFARQELREGLSHQYQAIHNASSDGDGHDAVSAQVLDTEAAKLGVGLIYFNVAVLIGVGVASYALARRTLRPIEQAHEAQVNFTSEASHELKTPLAAIKADTEATLMNPGATKQDLATTLKRNLEDIERLEALSASLMELARVTARPASEQSVVNIDEIIRDVVRRSQSTAQVHEITVTHEASPVQTRGDLHSLVRLVTIVVDNAIKYGRHGGHVWVDSHPQGRNNLVLSVRDDGIGISKRDLPHVYERFYRGREAEANHGTGSGFGLGLAMAKEIVQLHHGTIAIDSREGSGTKVVITLPRLV